MRLLFLNPSHASLDVYMKEIGRCGRKSAAGEIWPQTGLAYLASVARHNGSVVDICDAMALKWNPSATAKYIRRFSPDILFIHTSTPTLKSDSAFLSLLRPHLPPETACVVLGGHVSALGASVLEEFPADYALVGEGEGSIDRLTKSGGPLLKPTDPSFSPSEIPPGLFWLDSKDKQPRGTMGDFVSDLNLLPLPARDLLPCRHYRMPFFRKGPFATVIPSRGCPYGCTFCRAGLSWGKKVRTRTPENVLAEIDVLQHKFNIHNIVFMTDSFTFDRDWVMRFCKLLSNEKRDVQWICNSRVDAVDQQLLSAMKHAGCILISYGLESGNQRILDSVRKGISLDQSRNAVKWTKHAGITAFGYFIFGLPGEDQATVQETIDFALEVDPDYALFHIATPFPGTELYKEAKENGLLVNENWELFDEQTAGMMRTVKLSAHEIRNARNQAIRRFYFRPRRILEEISRLRSPYTWVSHFVAASRVVQSRLDSSHQCSIHANKY